MLAQGRYVGGSEKVQKCSDVIQGWSLSKYWDIGFCVSRFSLPTQFQFPPRRFCPLWSKEPLGVRVLLCKQIKLQPTSLLPGTLALPSAPCRWPGWPGLAQVKVSKMQFGKSADKGQQPILNKTPFHCFLTQWKTVYYFVFAFTSSIFLMVRLDGHNGVKIFMKLPCFCP